MYMTMSIQSTPLAKEFITHITDIRTLSIMYSHVYSPAALTKKPLPHKSHEYR